jgi:hypothetical protein
MSNPIRFFKNSKISIIDILISLFYYFTILDSMDVYDILM